MHTRWLAPLFLFIASACSDSDRSSSDEPSARDEMERTEALSPRAQDDPAASEAEAASDAAGSPAPSVDPAQAPSGEDVSSFAMFMDPATGFMTDAVHDADREVVHFDLEAGSMVSAASGVRISGWSVMGNDLDWSRNSVPFRVRFGTEAGERRAYFTEAGPGTICNLRVIGPESLSISGTSETPPNP